MNGVEPDLAEQLAENPDEPSGLPREKGNATS